MARCWDLCANTTTVMNTTTETRITSKEIVGVIIGSILGYSIRGARHGEKRANEGPFES